MVRRILAVSVGVLLVLAVLFAPRVSALGVSALAAASARATSATAATGAQAPAAQMVQVRQPLSVVAASPARTAGSQALPQLYQAVDASVVEVVNLAQASNFSNTPVEQGLGSGFVWDNAGDIVTNDHVVQGADALQVIFSDGTRVNATLVGTDPSSDLAVVKVDPSATTLQPVKQADMSQVEVGQDVVAIGNPYGFQGTLTVGIVSGLGRTISSQTQFSIPNAIQTDAAINPGNSGGPLLNLAGEVLGVNDQIESASGSNSGVGFAIPISIVQKVVPALITGGSYQHPYLGISAGTYNSTWASELGLPAGAKGVYVMDVAQGGPAAAAGLRGGSQNSNVLLSVSGGSPEYLPSGGDLITAIDGQPVKSMDELMTYLSEKTSAGQTVQLTVVRGNKTGTVNVTLGVQPGSPSVSQTTS